MKEFKTVEVTVKPKKIRSNTFKDVLYIRNVPKTTRDKFQKYATKLNMKRSELFEVLVTKCLKTEE